MEFMEALPPVVDRILSLFALGIGFPETFFKDVSALSCLMTGMKSSHQACQLRLVLICIALALLI